MSCRSLGTRARSCWRTRSGSSAPRTVWPTPTALPPSLVYVLLCAFAQHSLLFVLPLIVCRRGYRHQRFGRAWHPARDDCSRGRAGELRVCGPPRVRGLCGGIACISRPVEEALWRSGLMCHCTLDMSKFRGMMWSFHNAGAAHAHCGSHARPRACAELPLVLGQKDVLLGLNGGVQVQSMDANLGKSKGILTSMGRRYIDCA